MIRYERLRGKDALWVVGTDHAGIATQMVVERQMEARQDKRTNYSREDFVDKVWEWKEESRRHDHAPAAPLGVFDGLVAANSSRWTSISRMPCSRPSSTFTTTA